jgi:hypothetical protein
MKDVHGQQLRIANCRGKGCRSFTYPAFKIRILWFGYLDILFLRHAAIQSFKARVIAFAIFARIVLKRYSGSHAIFA